MNRSSVLDLKSPLERGGPLAVGSVCSETRFQPGTVFKIEQSLFSDEIMVVSSIGKPYLASDTNGVFQSLETHTLRHFVALLPQGRT